MRQRELAGVSVVVASCAMWLMVDLAQLNDADARVRLGFVVVAQWLSSASTMLEQITLPMLGVPIVFVKS